MTVTICPKQFTLAAASAYSFRLQFTLFDFADYLQLIEGMRGDLLKALDTHAINTLAISEQQVRQLADTLNSAAEILRKA